MLSKDSANLLTAEENKYPGPMTEIKFWEAKCMNLESLYEQMKAQTTRNMASILENTDSAYYPVFRSMFRQGENFTIISLEKSCEELPFARRNVVAALNEAQDITLYLRPLAAHFQSLEQSDFPDTVPQLRIVIHVAFFASTIAQSLPQ